MSPPTILIPDWFCIVREPNVSILSAPRPKSLIAVEVIVYTPEPLSLSRETLIPSPPATLMPELSTISTTPASSPAASLKFDIKAPEAEIVTTPLPFPASERTVVILSPAAILNPEPSISLIAEAPSLASNIKWFIAPVVLIVTVPEPSPESERAVETFVPPTILIPEDWASTRCPGPVSPERLKFVPEDCVILNIVSTVSVIIFLRSSAVIRPLELSANPEDIIEFKSEWFLSTILFS